MQLGVSGKTLVMMAFYTQHKTHCSVLCFVACGDAVAWPVERSATVTTVQYLRLMKNVPASVNC